MGWADSYAAAANKKLQRDKFNREGTEEGFNPDGSINPGYMDKTNPSYQRAAQAARFKQMGSAGYIPDDQQLTLGQVWAIRNPNQEMPETLKPHSEKPYNPRYDNLLTSQKLGDMALGTQPELQAAYEKALKLPPGSAANVTIGKAMGGVSNVRGQEAAGERTGQTIGAQADRQQAEIAAQAQRQADAQAFKETMETGQHSAGQKAMDTSFAKEFSQYQLNGGQAKARADMNAIQKSIDRLKTYDPGLTGRAAGFLGSTAQDAIDPEMSSIRDSVHRAMTGSAKENFPGRMSTSEFQNYLKGQWNPHLSPQENASRLQETLDKMKAIDAERNRAANHMRANKGTLYGYQPSVDLQTGNSMGGEDDLGPEDQPPPKNPSDLRAKAAKTGGAAVNGGIIPKKTLDQIRSMPTKGTADKPQEGAIKEVAGTKFRRKGGKWVEIMPGEATE